MGKVGTLQPGFFYLSRRQDNRHRSSNVYLLCIGQHHTGSESLKVNNGNVKVNKENVKIKNGNIKINNGNVKLKM